MELRIDTIDTSSQAQAFANRISGEPKTFFLQGSWGSGKSRYLKQVESRLSSRFKFVQLELWNPKSKATLAQKLFSATNPIISKFSTTIGWVLIVLMVCGSTVLSWEGVVSRTTSPGAFPLLITAIAVIVTTLYKFLQSKWLDIDRLRIAVSSWTLRCKRRPRVLVIDDFDRLDGELQKELYVLFNAIRKPAGRISHTLHAPARVIFVGDFQKLKGVEDDYLGKIIDQKVMLPFQLRSKNVAQRISDKLAHTLEGKFDCDPIMELFASEDRTARDANQFLALVEAEFMEQKKDGKVQTDQELLVIYLHMFHSREYNMLLKGWLPKEDQDENDYDLKVTEDRHTADAGKTANSSTVMKCMYHMFQPRGTNPPDFRKNASAYFVNELANNHSNLELRNIIESNDDRLKQFFLTTDSIDHPDYEEFSDYIEGMGSEEYKTVQSILEATAIYAMHSETRHIPNRLVKLVFKKRLDLISGEYIRANYDNIQEKTPDILDTFNEIFRDVHDQRDNSISPTEQMYYYRTCLNLYGVLSNFGSTLGRTIPLINEQNVSTYFDSIAKEIEKRENFGKTRYDAEALIVQLGYRYWLDGSIELTQNPDFQSKVSVIEKLDFREYRAFWEVYRIEPWEKDKSALRGGAVLDFDYHGEKYEEVVLGRLRDGR